MNRKFDFSAKGDGDGDWLEHFKNFLSLAHQASYIAAGANHASQRDFLQKIVSNLKLYNRTLIISYSSDFKFMAENRHLEMGSLLPSNSKIFFKIIIFSPRNAHLKTPSFPPFSRTGGTPADPIRPGVMFFNTG